MRIVGMRRSEFDTRDGKHIAGTSIYCTYHDDRVTGEAVEKIFVTDEKCPDVGALQLSDEIKVYYNKYGKVDGIELV